MTRVCFLLIALALLSAGCVYGADNELTQAEKDAGWILLFNGKNLDGWKALDGWKTANRFPSKTPVEHGSINPHGCGGYMVIYEEPFEDFVLTLDLKLSYPCNSGIFLRTSPLEPPFCVDVGFNGVEVAIDTTTGTTYTDPGAIYDLVRPTRNAMKPAGEWNHFIITNHENLITVTINGDLVNIADLDQFTEPGKRPDGTSHKFDLDNFIKPDARPADLPKDIPGTVFKDHPRKGYVGLQDHGAPCWYKNIKLKPVKK